MKQFILHSGRIEKATEQSAAFDLFYNGTTPLFIGDRVTAIPTGVRTWFSAGLVAIIKEKSGLALKGIEIKAGVIDGDYDKEWLVLARKPRDFHVLDITTGVLPIADQWDKDWKPFMLSPGEKIAQVLLVDLPTVDMVGSGICYKNQKRTGGFGSTGQ